MEQCRVRISLVTETFPPEINGVALTNFRLVGNLRRKGHDVELIRPQPRRSAIRGYWRVDREFRVAGLPLPFYPGMRVGSFCRKRLLCRWTTNRPEIVHIATEGPLGLAALLAARQLRIPVTSTFHTNFQQYCCHYRVGFLRSQVLRYLRWFHNQCATTLVPTPDLSEHLENLGFLRLQHLGRGVDRELFNPARRSPELRRKWGAGTGAPVVLCVSRMAREKNLPLVLQTFLRFKEHAPHSRMVMVGDGPFLPSLRHRFPQAHYAGMRFDEDLAAHYASADLFFFASVTETFGNVILEAMASGLVVLSYDYAAGRRFIQHRRSGMLAPYDQADLFQQTARELLHDRNSWPLMAEAARERTSEAPWTSVVDQFEATLRRFVENGDTDHGNVIT